MSRRTAFNVVGSFSGSGSRLSTSNLDGLVKSTIPNITQRWRHGSHGTYLQSRREDSG